MKRIIALLLVCLTLVEMLPLGIHTHAQETETLPTETVETMAATEGTALPAETVAETVPATEPTEETAPETAETVPETVETVPEITLEEGRYQIILDGITNDPVEETGEVLVEDFEGIVLEEAAAASDAYESEPNDTFSKADFFAERYNMYGKLSGYDVDYYYFRLSAKSKISIIAVATNKSFAIALLDSNGEIILKDIKGTKNDAGNYTYKIAGTYSAGTYGILTIDGEQNTTTYGFGMIVEPLYETCKHSKKKKQEVVEATCGTDGYTLYYCPTCEYTFKDKIVPATGNHTYYDQYDSICDVCRQNRYLGIARGECGRVRDDGSNLMNWVLYDDGTMVVSGWGDMQLNNGAGMPWDSYKSKIKKLEVKNEVFSIADHAFQNCENLTGIDLVGTVSNVENGAFSGCTSLTSVTLREGVRRIGDDTFGSCTALRRMNIPASVNDIHSGAFVLCSNLAAFYVDSGNTVYSSDSQGILYNKDKTKVLDIPRAISGNITIPGTVTEFGDSFSGRTKVTGVVLPELLTKIPNSFFEECDNLKYVTLPRSLTAIPANAFYGCGSLTSVTIPENVTSIGAAAFDRCAALTSITIPKAVTSVGNYAFEYCSALDEVTFLGSAPTFGSYSFYKTVAAVYYPITNTTWTSSKRQNYGGTLTWVGKCIDGHIEVIDTPGVAPTCLETGLSPDSHCSNCGEIISVQGVLPALGHDRVTDDYAAPFCETTGLTEGSHCARCGEVFVAQSVIPALGHDRVTDDYVAPLCEETGLTEGSHCARCGEVFVAQTVIPVLGHSYTDHWCDHCGRAEFVEVVSITADRLTLATGQQADLTAVFDYPIRPETEVVWTLAEGDAAYATLEPGREKAVLAAKRLLEEKTVTVYAKTADGLQPPVKIEITIEAVQADRVLYSSQSVTLKPINPATNKAYAAKELAWSMDERYEPFIKLANGKVTAQKVPEKVRTEVAATVKATGEILYFAIDVYPAVALVQVKRDGETVNGKTVLLDYADQTMSLKVDTYPLDTLENVTWTVSDKKGQYADYTIDGDSLTISNPRGNAGIVTIKATVSAGVKKSATVKVRLGSFAREVTMTKPGTATLRGGESVSLSAWVSKPAVVTQPGVVWTVSDKKAATVTGGKITAKNVTHPTTVTVTATSKDGQASTSIDLKIIPKDEGKLVLMCSGDYVTGGTKAMNYGESCRLEAYTIVNGDPVPEQVTWTSAAASVAYVSAGKVTAIGAGSAKITATAADGRTALVTVKVGTLVTDMRIITKDGRNMTEEDGERIVLLASGKTVNLVADILTTGAGKAVTWEIIEGAEYARLANGKLTANSDMTKTGYVTVRATAKDGSGVSSTIRVKILPLATGIQIYQNGTRVRSNTTFVHDMLTTDVIRLSARVYPSIASQSVVMTSSNKNTADFNEKGELVCFKPGTVTITAAAQDGSGQKVTFKLVIVKRITGLQLKENANLAVAGGKSLKLAPLVQISPADATNKKLTWSVGPNQNGITINASGVLSTKKVTQPVTINVMVTTQDGSGCMLSFDVTVYPA